jgi:pyruvate formate lyase activating enzyme
MQAGFVADLLGRCRHAGIHTAVETCGHASWHRLEVVLEQTDLLLFDLKHMDTDIHKQRTGVGNERILDNAVRAAEQVPEMIIRFPLIPDFNDASNHIKELASFIRDRLPKVKRVDVLPYHSMGESKMVQLGRTYALSGLRTFSTEEIDNVEQVLRSFGLETVRGG